MDLDERGSVIRSEVVLELRCEVCGVLIEQRREGRPRRFCGSRCRSKCRRVGAVSAIVVANAAERRELAAYWGPDGA